MPVVRDLITKLSWRVDKRSLIQANEAFKQTSRNARVASAGIRQSASDFVFATRRWFLGSLALIAVGRALGSSAIEFQQFRVTLVNVTRSTERANDAFRFLTKFAAETPFSMSQVVSSFIRLQQTTTLAFRTQPMEEFGRILTGLGDLASGVQTDVDNLVQGIQQAVAGRTQRLQNALKITIQTSGDTIRFLFRDRIIEAEKTVEGLTEALTVLGEEEFGGSMQRQLKTAGGALRNFVDIIELALFSIGEGGFLDGLSSVLKAMGDWVETNKAFLRLLGAIIGTPLKLFGFLLRGITATWRLWNGILLTFLALKLVGTVARMSRAIAVLAARVGIATTAWGAFWTAIFAPLAILLAFEDFDGFLKGHRSVIGLLVDSWEDLPGPLGEIGRTLRELQTDFGGFTQVVGGLMSALWQQIKAGVLELASFIAEAFGFESVAEELLRGAENLRAGREPDMNVPAAVMGTMATAAAVLAPFVVFSRRGRRSIARVGGGVLSAGRGLLNLVRGRTGGGGVRAGVGPELGNVALRRGFGRGPPISSSPHTWGVTPVPQTFNAAANQLRAFQAATAAEHAAKIAAGSVGRRVFGRLLRGGLAPAFSVERLRQGLEARFPEIHSYRSRREELENLGNRPEGMTIVVDIMVDATGAPDVAATEAAARRGAEEISRRLQQELSNLTATGSLVDGVPIMEMGDVE